jgi:hypothetical protein
MKAAGNQVDRAKPQKQHAAAMQQRTHDGASQTVVDGAADQRRAWAIIHDHIIDIK